MEIKVRNVSKSFGPEPVLKDISMETSEGDSLLIYGKNGAGKTTLLKLLNLLETPDRGEICYQTGQNRYHFPNDRRRNLVIQRKMVFVPQTPVIFSGCLYRNVELGLRLRGELKPAAEMETGLKMFGLWELKERWAAALSSGQKQKTSLLRSLLLDCKLVLLDEPTNHLDEKGKEALKTLLLEKRARGIGFIVSTPDLKEWTGFPFDKTYHLREGGLDDISLESKGYNLERDTDPVLGTSPAHPFAR